MIRIRVIYNNVQKYCVSDLEHNINGQKIIQVPQEIVKFILEH